MIFEDRNKNYLLELLRGKEDERIGELFPGQNSKLWSTFSYKDKYYTIKNIVDDMLELAPFGDPRLPALVKFVEERRNVRLWDAYHYRYTKAHRGSIRRELQKRYRKYRIQRKKEQELVRVEQQRLEAETLENKKEIAVIEFDIELTQRIADNNIPKDDRRNLSLQEAHKLLIEEYTAQGLTGVVQQLKSHPARQEETFDEVADRIKNIYLKKYDLFHYSEFKEALDARAVKTKRFFYKGKDLYPKK